MTQTKEPQVTAKNTKNEILSAYESMLEKAREMYKKNKQQEKLLLEKEKMIREVSENASVNVVQNLNEISEQIGKQINQVATALDDAYGQLKQVKEAILIEENNLKEMYEITKTTHTLDALLLAHEREEQEFNESLAQQKKQWDLDQQNFEKSFNEEKEAKKKLWQREQEEYHYKISLQRQKEQDEYDSKKAKQEQDLAQEREQLSIEFNKREKALTEKEGLLAQLQEKVDNFPTELTQQIESEKALLEERLLREHKFQFDLLMKDRESEKSLSGQTISSLQSKLESQEKLIKELSEKASNSVLQVQDIAIKAIEGASNTKGVYYQHEIKEQKDI